MAVRCVRLEARLGSDALIIVPTYPPARHHSLKLLMKCLPYPMMSDGQLG